MLALLLITLLPPQISAQQSDAAKIYSQSSGSVLLILVKSSNSKIVAQGTGFLVEGGKISTNEHVVRGGTAIIDLGGVRIPATIALTDDVNDIAILTLPAEISAKPLVLADRIPPPGSNVFAIGNPRGLEKSIEKAAELMPTSDVSAYNVALCFRRLGSNLDAVHWYEETLRRNPNRTDKEDLLRLILSLRR